jgi:hypothetical protein
VRLYDYLESGNGYKVRLLPEWCVDSYGVDAFAYLPGPKREAGGEESIRASEVE